MPARHAARLHHKSSGVRDDCLFKTDLRAVRKAGHHRRILAPLLGEALLRGRIAIGILQAFDVSHHSRSKPEPFDPAVQIHLHTRFVSFARGQNHSMFGGISLENWADGRVDLRVHQHHIFAVLECLENNLRAELHGTGGIHHHIHLLGSREQKSRPR